MIADVLVSRGIKAKYSDVTLLDNFQAQVDITPEAVVAPAKITYRGADGNVVRRNAYPTTFQIPPYPEVNPKKLLLNETDGDRAVGAFFEQLAAKAED